jgi:hypothetical protein
VRREAPRKVSLCALATPAPVAHRCIPPAVSTCKKRAVGKLQAGAPVRRLPTYHLKLAFRNAALSGRSAATIFSFRARPRPALRVLGRASFVRPGARTLPEINVREAAASAASSCVRFRSRVTRGRTRCSVTAGIVNNFRSFAAVAELGDRDRTLVMAPMFHVAPLLGQVFLLLDVGARV